MQTIAVIGAMAPEIELLAASLENKESQHINTLTFHIGKWADKRVIVALSGIGKVNAAICTTRLLADFSPDAVINTGSAGGLWQGLRVGDVVVADEVAHHDVDVTAFGYEWGQVPQLPARFAADDKLAAAAREAAITFEGGMVHRGLIVSGDQFIHSSAAVAAIRSRFTGVLAAEMEAAAIAQTCAAMDVPCVVVRAISDLADEAAEMSFDEFLPLAAQHSAKMVLALIAKL